MTTPTTVEKLNTILETIISIEDDALSAILMSNFNNTINAIQAKQSGTEYDVSEQIKIVTDVLGFDFEELVTSILEKDYINNQNGDYVNSDEADQASIDFILGNSESINNTNDESIDDYETFLSDTKENLDYLKGEI